MPLKIYNTLSREKEVFTPLTPDHVGMYVCGPTVYSDVHLGNCRTFISFDIIYRYLRHVYKNVRYVRNITDAGHLEGDRDEGDDKFSKLARLQKVEPMEIVQKYTLGFHHVMEMFNCLPPSIEPTATGHIAEQIEITKQILANGYAYEVNGTIYFDVEKYNKELPYGILTNRKMDDLLEGTRELGGQNEKRGRLDFALWIKAKPEHLMQWPSPWGMGFPGWHIECSAMSEKYLGKQFDIHGGGMDLAATHHTNEIAQSQACYHVSPANFWMHTNMLTVNGTRMSKSLGNGFLPEELFTGDHPLLEKAYAPMVVRFFMLQTHYRSTLDFSNEALQASEKGLRRLWDAYEFLKSIDVKDLPQNNINTKITEITKNIKHHVDTFDESMNDDFSTPKVIASMFELVPIINSLKHDMRSAIAGVDREELERMQKYFTMYLEDFFGLEKIIPNDLESKFYESIEYIIELREKAKRKKDYTLSDEIRMRLVDYLGVEIFDYQNGVTEYAFEDKKVFKNLKHHNQITFFETKRQKTFLIKSNDGIDCILQDKIDNTYQLKWHEPYEYFYELKPEVIFNDTEKFGRVDIGKKHKWWLVSKELFKNESDLSDQLKLFFVN